MMNKKPELNFEQVTIAFLVLLVTIISLFPFYKIGFTTADDLEYYMTFLSGDYFRNAQLYAQTQSRFYFLITKPLYSLIYASDSFIWIKVIQNACLLFAYFSFTCFIQKLFHSKTLSLALFVLLVCCTPVTSNQHIPFVSYPGFFSFSFALFCWALVLFLKYTETNRYVFAICSAILCFIAALFYENYLLFIFLFGLGILIRNLYTQGIRKTFTDKNFYREILPVASAAVLYVTIYFFYRHFADNQYDGNTIAHPINWENFKNIIYKCTICVAPLQQYRYGFDVMSANSQSLFGHNHDYTFILAHASLIAYINGLAVCFLATITLKKFKNKISWKAIAVVIPAALLFAFSAHLLIAVTSKYNLEWGSWIFGYVTSFFSYFGIILALLFVGYTLYKLVFHIKYARIAVGSALVLVLFGTVVIDTFTNEHFAHEWSRSHQRFDILDEMIEDKAFSQMRETDVLFCPSMYTSGLWGHGLFGNERTRLSKFIFLKSGNNITECSDLQSLKDLLSQDSTRQVVLLDLKEGTTHNDMLVTMAYIKPESWNFALNNPTSEVLCDSATLYFHSPCKRYLLMVNRQETDSTPALLGGRDTVWLSGQWNRIPVSAAYRQHKRTSSVVHIQSRNMKASDFYISDLSERYDERYLLGQ